VQPWKAIAYKSPATKHLWVFKGIKDDDPEIAHGRSWYIIHDFIEDAKQDKIWLLHRRVGPPEDMVWEMVWKPKRGDRSSQ
jgi:hypothetical protein